MTAPPSASLTLLLLPERSARVRRLKFSRRRLYQLGALMVLLLGGGVAAMCHYVAILSQARHSEALRHQNITLRAQLLRNQQQLQRIDGTLQQIETFSRRVRSITELSDPQRNLAISPLGGEAARRDGEVLYAQGERIDVEDELLSSSLALRLLDADLEAVEDRAGREVTNLQLLHDSFEADDLRLSHTPSIRPTPSKLLISAFGERLDPYTEHPVMHKGIDLAADAGSAVLAPADGRVIFAGSRGGGYGNLLVLDHGMGYQTHFAHLEAFGVRPGEQVARGHPIATVGNSGRSRGAHLHYEVRYLGVPCDPEFFILD